MFLITFDIVGSKQQEQALNDLFNMGSYKSILCNKYNILPKDIEVKDGDQIRILLLSSKDVFQIIFEILKKLTENKFKARIYVTKGTLKNYNYEDISQADGDIFYKSKELEDQTKHDRKLYTSKNILIRYLNKKDEMLIDTLLLSLSTISLKKDENVGVLYNTIYENKTQKQIAKEYNVSQVTISKKLNTSNVYMLQKIMKEIEKLLKEEE